MRKLALVGALFAVIGCRDLYLPPPPPAPGPGTISGRAVLAVPGRSEKKPAAGAFVRLLPTGLVTRADGDGLFVLEGVTRATGELLFQHDADNDGHFERQRLVRVDGYAPGHGRQVQLGDVFLEENASVRGRVLRADVTGNTGHAGSLVFVPEGPFTATTSDDGVFLLEDMPPGVARLAFFRAGYSPRGYEEITLSSGQELLLSEVLLEPLGPGAAPGTLTGQVVATPVTPLTAVRAEVIGSDGVLRVASVDADGRFTLANLASDLYRVNVQLEGYRPATLVNVLVSPGETTDLGVLDLVEGAPVVLPDAGPQPVVDSGVPDAGVDSGTPDAGPDPRAPTASAPAALLVRPSQLNVTLDGSGSTDPNGSVLIYHWRQTSGPTVTFSVNDTLNPTTRFTAPASSTLLRFELTVSNALGLTSAPAVIFVTVQAPPTAQILPSTLTLRTGLTVELDGSGSDDPAGGALTYMWSVVSGPVTLEALDGGGGASRVRLRAGATTGAGEVRLVVSNSLGMSSDPAVLPVVVNSDPVVVRADAGLPEYVGLGSPVSLRASASSTFQGDLLSYAWMQVLADGGSNVPADAGVQLSGANGAVATFTAPSAPTDLYFRVTVTGSESGAAGFASKRIGVLDDKPPSIVASDPPVAGSGTPSGPWQILSATFDEALDPTTVTSTNFRLMEADAGVAVDAKYDGTTRTVKILPRRPLTPGASAALIISGVADASPQRNVMLTTTLPFSVRSYGTRKYTHPTNSSADVRPVPLIGTPDSFIGWFHTGAGCGAATSGNFAQLTANGLVAAGSYGCGCNRNEQRNHAVIGGKPYYRCDANLAYRPATSWVQYADGAGVPHSINGDGVTLGGTAQSSGLIWSNLTPTGWATYSSVEASGSYMATTETYAFGGAVSGNRSLALGITTTRALRIFEQVDSGAWTDLSETAPAAGTYMPRGAYVGTRPVVCHTHQPTTALLLRCLVRNGSGWDAYENVGGGAVERIFDVHGRGDTVFVTFARAGKIYVRMLDTAAAAPAFVDLPSIPGELSWNNNPACGARNPAMQLTDDAVWVAFQETCTGPWTAVLRAAE